MDKFNKINENLEENKTKEKISNSERKNSKKFLYVIYFILGIGFIFLIGYSIYYFNYLKDDENSLDTSLQEENNKSDENKVDMNDVNNNNIENDHINDESNYFKEVDINELVNLIDNKEDFILILSQTWCGHCTNYKPKVEEVANNHKIVVYFIEYNLLSEDDKNILNGYIDFYSTPTTVFFNDGIEILDARISGDIDIDEIENIFRNNGYIK